MPAPIRVLYLFSEPGVSPAQSVHATILRHLDRDCVHPVVALTRAVDGDFRGRSITSLLPSDLDRLPLLPAGIGPGSASTRAWAGAAALLPATLDLYRLAAEIRRRGIDIVHCDEGTRNGFLGLVLARLTGVRCLIHFHSQYGDWMSRPSRYSVAHADRIVPVSEWTGRVITERSATPPARVTPVVNGIEVSRWDPDAVDGAPVRAEFGVGHGETLIVQVAQLAEWKRQHDLIAAMRIVAQRRPDARVALIGAENLAAGGPLGYADRLRDQIAEAELSEQVTLAGQRSDISAVLKAADVFCLPSEGDPCALAHIEAMAMGLPVVTVDNGGGPELVRHGVTGLVGRCRDVEQLAGHLLELIENPDQARQMGVAGRERAVTYLNARRMARDVEVVYQELLAAG